MVIYQNFLMDVIYSSSNLLPYSYIGLFYLEKKQTGIEDNGISRGFEEIARVDFPVVN